MGHGSWTMRRVTSCMVPPLNGLSVVRRLNSTTPSEKMSERPSTALPVICSGDMKLGVPMNWPSTVRLEVSRRAMPKSVILAVPSPVRMMLAGLMSRWTTPSEWA